MRRPAWLNGVTAGAVGTLVVQLMSSPDGERPVYAPDRLAGQLSRRWLHRELRGSRRRRFGTLLRWLYGPGWGAAFGEVQGAARVPHPVAGLGLGLAVLAFELAALPLTRATPPLKQWGRRQIAGDALQTILFGAATASAFLLLSE